MDRAIRNAEELRSECDASLKEQVIRDGLRVAVKSIFDYLRRWLDDVAHDPIETHCSAHPKRNRIYFPISLQSWILKPLLRRTSPA